MFTLPSDLEAFQTRIRTFACEKIAPVAAQIDRTAEYPTGIHHLLAGEGYMRMVANPKPGPTRFLARAILIEEVAYASAAVSMIPMVNELGCTPVQLFGTQDQKAHVLEGVANGTLFASYGLTEPQAGSDVAALQCRAEKAGEDWIITGEKSWICNVRQPGVCVVFARTGVNGARDALTAFLVPTDARGFEVTGAEPTLGLRGSPTFNFHLNGLRVSSAQILGKPGDGFRVAMMTLNHTRPAVGAQALGIARAAYDAALHHARTRNTFGHPLIEHQAVGFMLADMHMRIRAARHLVYEANLLLDEKTGGDPVASSTAKCFASDTAMQVAMDAVQIFGGDGYSTNHPVERFFRDAKVTQIYEGTNQIQRMVIARRLATAEAGEY